MSPTCTCQSGKPYAMCCQPLIDGKTTARHAEQLMRSRYTAFANKKFDYLLKTTHPNSLKNFDLATNQAWMNKAAFTKLEVINSIEKGDTAEIEFKAFYDWDGSEHIHHEHAQFERVGDFWFYIVSLDN